VLILANNIEVLANKRKENPGNSRLPGLS